ncbi:ATP-dependent metalloprotease FtsH [Pirellula staleyi DSM 6068]|uniref:ATP-dependent zinc metalloprotease FtsH n=1 Tax=Pirellula staleyi (strain ATCC 27377 / DSM 6068 / ICPB 4128) TaxID=530564 RepID=D2R981_PIRSD|nr:ATP-dependent zinc metalloprotease FtsH [Pirellula staleyi]ADB17631.1 ATP-dependent metalloprotease FtsH [Pirellula staleyi DSM 6068]
MERNELEDQSAQDKKVAPRNAGPGFLLPLLLAMIAVGMLIYFRGPASSMVPYSVFKQQLRENNVERVSIGQQTIVGQFRKPIDLPIDPKAPLDAEGKPKGDAKTRKSELRFETTISSPTILQDDPELSKLIAAVPQQDFVHEVDPSIYMFLFSTLLVVGIMVGFWIWLRRSQNQMMGGGFLSGFSKSPAKRYEASRQAITFKDVAGLEGVKADMQELVDFLKQPKKFQKLGGRVPKGVLLNGPPGTGKTLLARAVAGEAGVPYYSVSGSEFIQMFVGVGASRVRDLFRTAKENSPAIIFIDEIDAVGRQRGAGLGGGHDEREQTLNQILSEMDGFSQSDFVIVLAATNRPDVLDPALLRPGRFDRHITVGRPTQKGRVEIFKVHTRDVPLGDDVSLESLAAGTIGLTGADIRNIVNEAALWAARNDKTTVDMSDFEYARDKILMGPKREEVLQEDEKEKTAYHEAGHTLLAWKLPGANRVHKVTIIPRGRTLGATQMLPSEDKMNASEPELRDHLAVLLAGRAAEQIVYQQGSVGAENDLERATGLARRMVMQWGMSDRLGPVSYKISDDDPFLGREMHQQRSFSEHTLEVIDEEVSRILRESAARAESLLNDHREALDAITKALLEKEELDEKEIAELIGPSIHDAAKLNGHAQVLKQNSAKST